MSTTKEMSAGAFSRTMMLVGEDTVLSLQKKHVAIFGVGGVGGYVCEALVRCGIGAFTLIDKDVVDITNINRQIIATMDTVGKAKTSVMAERMRSINPAVEIIERKMFFLPENADAFDFASYDYIVDAIDTVTAKLALIQCAKGAGTPIISAMGAGNKLHPEMFEIADIYDTSVCPLARVMRRELKKRNITDLKVVYSKEPPVAQSDYNNGKATPGSVAFAPSVAGLLIAGEVFRELCLV